LNTLDIQRTTRIGLALTVRVKDSHENNGKRIARNDAGHACCNAALNESLRQQARTQLASLSTSQLVIDTCKYEEKRKSVWLQRSCAQLLKPPKRKLISDGGEELCASPQDEHKTLRQGPASDEVGPGETENSSKCCLATSGATD
jgi:hypothetical protein